MSQEIPKEKNKLDRANHSQKDVPDISKEALEQITDIQGEIQKLQDEKLEYKKDIYEKISSSIESCNEELKDIREELGEKDIFVVMYNKFIAGNNKIKFKDWDYYADDEIALDNLVTNLLTALKRTTNSYLNLEKSNQLGKQSEEIKEKYVKIIDNIKNLKKDINEYIKQDYELDEKDKILRVMDTRIDVKLPKDPTKGTEESSVTVYRQKDDTKIEADLLFPKGGHPSPDDVYQVRGHDDCYLMSALKAIASKSPQAIEKCFVDFKRGCAKESDKEKFKAMDKVKVKLYSIKLEKVPSGGYQLTPTARILVIVDKKRVDPENKKSALWVHLIKKAFLGAVLKTKPVENTLKQPSDLEKCNDNKGKNTDKLGTINYIRKTPYISAVVSASIIGETKIIFTNSKTQHRHDDLTPEGSGIYYKIETALKEGKVVTVASSRLGNKDSKYKKNPQKLKGWKSNHQYYVTRCRTEANGIKGLFIFIGDAMQNRGSEYYKSEDGKLKRREVTATKDDKPIKDFPVTAESFFKYFGQYTISDPNQNPDKALEEEEYEI